MALSLKLINARHLGFALTRQQYPEVARVLLLRQEDLVERRAAILRRHHHERPAEAGAIIALDKVRHPAELRGDLRCRHCFGITVFLTPFLPFFTTFFAIVALLHLIGLLIFSFLTAFLIFFGDDFFATVYPT